MNNSFFIVSGIVSTLSALLPVYVYTRSATPSKDFRYLIAVLLITFAADAVGILNSLWLMLPYVNETASFVYYFMAGILSYFFYREFFVRGFLVVANVTILLLILIYGYWVLMNPTIIMRHESKIPMGIMLIIFTLMHFYLLIKKMPEVYVYQVPMFWINSGLLIYSSGTLILFLISNFVIYALKKDQVEYWIFHNFLNTLSNGLMAIGLFKIETKKHSR